MTTPLLSIENLFAEFQAGNRAKRVLDDISMTVGHNEIFGLVGESGSGKSTTARCVIGLLPPAGRMSGRIMFNGQDLAAMNTSSLRQVRGAQIGFVAQNPFDALNPVHSISKQFENVIRAHRKGSRRSVREYATELLTSVGIPDPDRVLRGYAHELSGGMAQRVVLAIALSLNPQLLIADEPTTALDLTVQRQVLDLMQNIVESSNRSMLLVTHDLTVVANYCQRVGVMYQGKILEVGSVESVFTNPQHPYTRALLDAAAGKGRMTGQTQQLTTVHSTGGKPSL